MELLRNAAALPAFAIEVIIAFAASPVISSPQLHLSMNLRAVVAAALAALVGVDAAVIAHDAVVPFPQPTPNTTIQTVAVKFKPQIYINNGCHPYPAVDKDGNTSGGLKPTGSQSAGCKGSGYGSQIYGRAVEYEGVYAFMYSWYMPKDETLDGQGHRHDWENCVVWLDSLDDPSVVALSASYHSTYLYYYPPDADYLDGNSAKIEYSTSWVILDHSLSATPTAGETQDLIMWDQLTDAARTALEDTDFGDANVPFKEANFATKVAKAYYA